MISTSKFTANSCCYAFSIQLGTFILLYIELASLSIGFMFCMFYEFGPTTKWPVDRNALNGFLLLSIFFTLIAFAIAVAGLVGLFKRKPSLLIPFLIYRIIFAFTIWCVTILQIFHEMNLTGLFFSKSITYFILLELLLTTIEVHFAQVVFSCYRQLEDSNTNIGIVVGCSHDSRNPPYSTLQDEEIYVESNYLTV